MTARRRSLESGEKNKCASAGFFLGPAAPSPPALPSEASPSFLSCLDPPSPSISTHHACKPPPETSTVLPSPRPTGVLFLGQRSGRPSGPHPGCVRPPEPARPDVLLKLINTPPSAVPLQVSARPGRPTLILARSTSVSVSSPFSPSSSSDSSVAETRNLSSARDPPPAGAYVRAFPSERPRLPSVHIPN